MNIDAFLNVFLILLNFGWMVNLPMSIFEFLTKFLIFRHPWVCIRSDLKPLFQTDMSDSSSHLLSLAGSKTRGAQAQARTWTALRA